jgi:hypothetical protein
MAHRSGPGELLELEEDRHLAELVSDWDFGRGKDFKQAIFSRYKTSVHHPASSPKGAFFLLAVFRRYTFCLTPLSVCLALHACLGGTPSGFHVNPIKDHHFCFAVASKVVRLAVTDLKCIITSHFDVYFHLWRDGGENWTKELRKLQEEEDASWQLISRRGKSSKRVSFARNLNQPSPVKKSSLLELKNKIKTRDFFFDSSGSTTSFPSSFSNSNFKIRRHSEPNVPTGIVFSQIKASLV